MNAGQFEFNMVLHDRPENNYITKHHGNLIWTNDCSAFVNDPYMKRFLGKVEDLFDDGKRYHVDPEHGFRRDSDPFSSFVLRAIEKPLQDDDHILRVPSVHVETEIGKSLDRRELVTFEYGESTSRVCTQPAYARHMKNLAWVLAGATADENYSVFSDPRVQLAISPANPQAIRAYFNDKVFAIIQILVDKEKGVEVLRHLEGDNFSASQVPLEEFVRQIS